MTNKLPGIHGEGYGTGLPNDGDYSDVELRALSWLHQQQALAAAIRLGYEAERDDPNLGFETPTTEEIEWLAGRLVGEGWKKGS